MRRATILPPYVWLLLFFLLPFVIVLKIAVSESRVGVPPYMPLTSWEEGVMLLKLNFANFSMLFEEPLYINAYLRSLRVAFISATLCLLVGYPMALAIARAPEEKRDLLLMLVVLPFWTSFLLRVMALIGLLQDDGVINNVLMGLGIIGAPIRMLYTEGALYVGIVYCYLPFMVLPLYATLSKLDPTLLEAAADLGAKPFRAFLSVTLPLSLPGILAGFMLVFIPAVGEFVIPELMGGPGAQLIGRVLWTTFFQERDWPLASALAIVLLLVLVIPIAILQRLNAQREAA